MNKTPESVIVDSVPDVQLVTPGGLIITVPYDSITGTVRDALDDNDDAHAAQAMHRLTGLPCTVRRTTQTTCRTDI